MNSRKIEERNEKIVRGLLKLPPNRRCINCNSLGPQYVCTNFWTFICTTCSGIHREFTHRVKSISMSKFTTEEIEALQNGGNQRARELFMKGWDFQIQRLPDSSNVDRVREFIKNVYMDKKYVTGKISDAPSTDSRSLQSHEEHIRASSYHSYSQSPPYDHQYEERKYGKKAPVLTRKPGSEKNLYEGKVMYSPTQMSEQACNDRYTKEGSNSRSSIHSESSWDPFRPENMSPTSCSIHDFPLPSAQASVESTSNTVLEENARRDVNKIPRPQKTQSSGSFGSFGRSSGSYDSCYSNSQGHAVSELDRNAEEHHNDMWAAPSLEKNFSIEKSSTVDLFADPVVPQLVASSTVDFFQLCPTSTSTVNLVQGSTMGTASMTSPSQSFNISQASPALFGGISQDLLHVTNLDQSSSDLTMPKNGGWATFDTQTVPRSDLPIVKTTHIFDNISSGNSISVSPLSEKTFLEPCQSDGRSHTHAHNLAPGTYPLVPSPWSDTMYHNQASSGAGTSQLWSGSEDPMGHAHWESIPPKNKSQITFGVPTSDINQCMNPPAEEGPRGNSTNSSMLESVLPFSMYQHTSSVYNPEWQSSTTKYTNPFDVPFDSASDPNKVFPNLDSLRAALPSDIVQPPFPDEFTEPWFSQHPVTSFPASTTQASIPYMAGQSPTSQFSDVSPHVPLASVGGNPFA